VPTGLDAAVQFQFLMTGRNMPRYLTLSLIIALFLLPVLAGSWKKEDPVPKNDIPESIIRFIELRKEGDTAQAYRMLSEKSRRYFTFDDFDDYCFIYRIIDVKSLKKEGEGYYEAVYTYYDKRFKKGSGELYTFYITENIENIKTDETGLLFPHTGFIALRENIEKRDTESAEQTVKTMLSIDPENPDVLKSAEQMGFIPGSS
jgi:hypothetical protein